MRQIVDLNIAGSNPVGCANKENKLTMVAINQQSFDDKKLDDLIHFDSLDIAEKTTGKDYHEDKETSSLGFLLHITKNEMKRKILKKQDDVDFNGSIQDYIRISLELGFVPIIEEKIDVSELNKDNKLQYEMFYIYWHPTKAILLVFETYNLTHVNSSKWYFSYKPNGIDCFYQYFRCSGRWFGISNNTPRDQLIWVGMWDAREAIRHEMNLFDNYGHFVNPWPISEMLQLNTYLDWKKCGNLDYTYASQQSLRRFKMLPDYIQKSVVGHGRD